MTQPEFTDQQICDAANSTRLKEVRLLKASIAKAKEETAKLQSRLKYLEKSGPFTLKSMSLPGIGEHIFTRPNLFRCMILRYAGQQREVLTGDMMLADVIEPALPPDVAIEMYRRLQAADDAHEAKAKADAAVSSEVTR